MIKSVFGTAKETGDAAKCVKEAAKTIKDPKLVLFFGSETYFPEYVKLIHEMFPEAVSIGCSTYRTWNALGTGKDVLNIIALEDGIQCTANVIEKADNSAIMYADNVKQALNGLEDAGNSVCLEFTVPYKRAEEYALMALNSVLLRYDIPVIGGTAANVCADKEVSDKAYVALNGTIYPEGCVFVLIHNRNGAIHCRRENIYEPLSGREFVVTKANNLTRTIMSYDNRPAAQVYAEELDVPVEKIGEHFFHHPMGRCVDDDTYVTAIQEDNPNFSMKFHARVHEGTKMMVMQEGDYKKITKQTIEEVKNKVPGPSLVLMIHCVARTILFEDNGYIEEYQKMLAEAFPNFTGLACLGEQQGTKNFNHTMMLVIFE